MFQFIGNIYLLSTSVFGEDDMENVIRKMAQCQPICPLVHLFVFLCAGLSVCLPVERSMFPSALCSLFFEYFWFCSSIDSFGVLLSSYLEVRTSLGTSFIDIQPREPIPMDSDTQLVWLWIGTARIWQKRGNTYKFRTEKWRLQYSIISTTGFKIGYQKEGIFENRES